MPTSIKERLSGAFGGLSPRARQWALLGAISTAIVVLLSIVFSVGSDDAARRAVAAAARSDAKPTNVDMMAPGQQLNDREIWMGQAGRELERYRAEREEQRRLNREREAAQAELLKKFADLESQFRSQASAQASAAVQVPAQPVQPAPPPQPPPPPPRASTPFPPDGTMPRAGATPPPPPQPMAAVPPRPALVRVTVTPPSKESGGDGKSVGNPSPNTLDTFLPVSLTRGVLLGGLDAPTGGQSQGNPHPVLIRLSDNSVLPNRFRAAYRECFVIAAGYGDISSERAYLRTESLSCVRPDGQALELKIQGSVYGEDGKVGMRGRLVTKQGQILANALMAGVIGGVGQGLSAANTNYSTSAFGTVSSSGGTETLRSGVGSGVGKALDRLAQYYIKLAEQTFPIIEIDAGREIDVVLTKGVRIEGIDTAKASPTSVRPRDALNERYADPADEDRHQKVTNDE